MEKSLDELRADIAEAEAAIAKVKLESKREKARESLDKWATRHGAALNGHESGIITDLLNSLAPAQLTLGAKP